MDQEMTDFRHGAGIKEQYMYTCKMCKGMFGGEPALKNAAGEFCFECKATIRARIADGTRARGLALNGCCMWCGEKITDKNRVARANDPDKRGEKHVCSDCSVNRDWLLKCIRFSDKASKYAARAEDREREGREERNKRQSENRSVCDVIKESQFQGQPSEQEARLSRVEMMLNKLTQALGV